MIPTICLAECKITLHIDLCPPLDFLDDQLPHTFFFFASLAPFKSVNIYNYCCLSEHVSQSPVMPFSSPFHRDGLLRTKEYIPSSLFASSVVWTRTGKEETLTKVMPGPLNPDGPAAPDAVLIVIGIVSDSNFLKLGTVGNWFEPPSDVYPKPTQKFPLPQVELHQR